MENFSEIKKVQIPDNDVPGWIKSLHEGGFSGKEIDEVLGNLNLTYKKIKDPDFIEKELSEIKKYFWTKYKKVLTTEETECFRRGIEERMN